MTLEDKAAAVIDALSDLAPGDCVVILNGPYRGQTGVVESIIARRRNILTVFVECESPSRMAYYEDELRLA